MTEIAQTLKIVQLEGDLRAKSLQISGLINLVEQVRIALEEDDEPDEAFRLVKEALGD